MASTPASPPSSHVALPDSACVYCGNCIGVCPTGALMFSTEHEMRADGSWDEAQQTVTKTICPYCGVGCKLEVHVQDNEIVNVTSPSDHSVTHGHLCVKGRFGFAYAQSGRRRPPATRPVTHRVGRRVGRPGRSPAADATGLVLAGGRSTRFGSDKLVAPFRGAPLLHHAVRRMTEVCAAVVVVVAADAPEPDLPPGLGVVVARDAVSGGGPLAGVAAGLRHARTEWTVVAGGDMPDLSPEVLTQMLAEARTSNPDAVALLDEGGLRPLPAVVRTRPAIEAAASFPPGPGASVRALLRRLGALELAEDRWTALDPSRGTLHDVDEPGDLGLGGR